MPGTNADGRDDAADAVRRALSGLPGARDATPSAGRPDGEIERLSAASAESWARMLVDPKEVIARSAGIPGGIAEVRHELLSRVHGAREAYQALDKTPSPEAVREAEERKAAAMDWARTVDDMPYDEILERTPEIAPGTSPEARRTRVLSKVEGAITAHDELHNPAERPGTGNSERVVTGSRVQPQGQPGAKRDGRS